MLYGIDWDAPLTTNAENVDAIEVLGIPSPLSAADYAQLCHTIDPTAFSECNGVDEYISTVWFVERRIYNNCFDI